MANDDVLVKIRYRALPGREEAAARELEALIATVLAEEPDCHGITLLGEQDDSASLLLVEWWSSREAYSGPHLQTPHLTAFRTRADLPPESNPYRPSGEPWTGLDAVLNNLFMRLGAEWDGFAVHPKTFHDAGNSVIVEVRYSGTYKAIGRSMDAQVCHVWDLEDGKLTRFQQYIDTAKICDVMGVR
jgi:uncharacterized protein